MLLRKFVADSGLVERFRREARAAAMLRHPNVVTIHDFGKVADFGIAKLRDLAAGQTLTQTGMVLGMPYYMSPEQCCGEPLDARSDVYSLGAMLYEMLAGTPPFTARTPTGVIAKHLTEEPAPLPVQLGVPLAVEAVVLRALAKAPEARQQNALALARELRATLLPAHVSERQTPATQTSFQFASYHAPLQTTVTGAVEGRLVNARTGAPIAGATVQLIDQVAGVSYATRTDADGRFVKYLLRPSVYTVRISAPGFRTFEGTISLFAMDTRKRLPPPALEPEVAQESRCARTSNRPNQAPTVALSANQAAITLPCRAGFRSLTCTPSNPAAVQLTANASDPDGDALLYSWSTTGGRIFGEGANVAWDLTGVAPGAYTATTEVDDRHGCVAYGSTTVTVTECTDCLSEAELTTHDPPPCPNITVDCPPSPTQAGQPMTFTANISGGNPNVTPTFNWTVSAGTITNGQGTPSITVDTPRIGGQSVTATMDVGGYSPACSSTASCTASVSAPVCRKFDEYGNISFADEQARLDNFAIQLQNEPGAQGYIIAHAGRSRRAAFVVGIIEGWFLQATLAPAGGVCPNRRNISGLSLTSR